MTDGIKACTEDIADSFGGQEMTERWLNIYKLQDTRDADTIKKDICNRINRMRSE